MVCVSRNFLDDIKPYNWWKSLLDGAHRTGKVEVHHIIPKNVMQYINDGLGGHTSPFGQPVHLNNDLPCTPLHYDVHRLLTTSGQPSGLTDFTKNAAFKNLSPLDKMAKVRDWYNWNGMPELAKVVEAWSASRGLNLP
jgi:hypothetical protein